MCVQACMQGKVVACGLQEHASQAMQNPDAARRKVSETWLVLEYCSKGSLQDALDRSVCPSIAISNVLIELPRMGESVSAA